MHCCWRSFGWGCGVRVILLATGFAVLAEGAVAQVDRGLGSGYPSTDPSAWGDWPWRFRDQGSFAEAGHGRAPAAPGSVDGGTSLWGAPDVTRSVQDGAPGVDAGARGAGDQEYHFRGDSGPWTGARSGDDAGDRYRFRPLSERERSRMGYSSGWRSADPGMGESNGPDRSEGQRPTWPVEPPFRSWP